MLGSYDDAVARRNLKQDAFHAVKSGTPSFTAKTGFLCTSGKLQTGFNPVTAGGNYAQNSAHVSIGVLTDLASTSSDIHNWNGAQGVFLNLRTAHTPNKTEGRLNTSANFTIQPGSASSAHHWVFNRVASTQVLAYQEGALWQTFTSTSAAVTSFAFEIGALGTVYTTRRYDRFSLGGGLTAAQIAQQETNFNAFFTAINTSGFAITITPASTPIVGATLSPAFVGGSVGYSTTITPSALPITSAALTPFQTISYATTLTAGSLPVVGATLAPFQTVSYATTITPSALPIVGATLAPFQTVSYATTITPSALPVVGSALTPFRTFSYATTIAASSLPITGATLSLGASTSYSVTITPSALPIVGATVAPFSTFRYATTIAPSAVPITGATLSLGASTAYSVTITPSSVPVTGAAVAPVQARFLAVSAAAVPITGLVVAPLQARSLAVSPGALPVTGQILIPVKVARVAYTLTISPGSIPITGAVLVFINEGVLSPVSDVILRGHVDFPVALHGQAAPSVTLNGRR